MFEEAACRGLHEIFFDPAHEEKAVALCRICPCIAMCEPHSPDDFGVWGGTTREQRIANSLPTTIDLGDRELVIEWQV